MHFRVCDDDEDIPLHQRIQRARPALYPNLAEDTKPKPVYPIDECVLNVVIVLIQRRTNFFC